MWIKRLWLAMCVGAFTIGSCAATWTMRCTAPTQDNAGTCTAPILQPTTGGLVRVRLTWTGPTTGQDSLIVQPGAPCVFLRSGPSGNYRFIVVAADSSGNVSCPDTADVVVRGKFHAVTDLRVQ